MAAALNEHALPSLPERFPFTARDRAEAALVRALTLDARVLATLFTRLDPAGVRAEADALDEDAGRREGALFGLLVSIKDLFDEAGEATGAGSRLLSCAAPATRDAETVRRLKAAGALTFGRTTMSEFAYSGVGLNPHHGDPGNAHDPARISGGSTSGGGLTVALGLVDVALGSDTGGSVRIPAALNGLSGFKPTQGAVPLDGAFPLSPTYDSIGPIARDIATCARVHAVLSGQAQPPAVGGRVRLGVVRGALTEGMDETVSTAFEAALVSLRRAGFELEDTEVEHVAEAGPSNRVIVASDAHRIHRDRLDDLERVGDARVLKRIRAAEGFAPGEESEARSVRAAAVASFRAHAGGFDAFLMPTIPVVAPRIAEVAAEFDRLNALMLRNPSLVNFLDGCAASVPMQRRGDLPCGLSVFAPAGRDWAVLEIAERVEAVLRDRA